VRLDHAGVVLVGPGVPGRRVAVDHQQVLHRPIFAGVAVVGAPGSTSRGVAVDRGSATAATSATTVKGVAHQNVAPKAAACPTVPGECPATCRCRMTASTIRADAVTPRIATLPVDLLRH